MTNLNLELIEKVKSGKAAIKFDRRADSIDRLNKILRAAFPADTELPVGLFRYYQAENTKECWTSLNETKLEVIPLSAFFTEPNLSLKDKALISDMNERLKRLEELYEYSPFGAKLKDAIDTTEGEQEQGKELAPIETEKTKEFTYNTFVQHDNFDGYSVLITVNTQSKETAYKKLDAIKQYLSTNKF